MFVEDTLQRKQKKQKSVSPRDEGWVREEMARQKNAWVCALPAESGPPKAPEPPHLQRLWVTTQPDWGSQQLSNSSSAWDTKEESGLGLV